MPPNVWYHLTGTWDGTTRRIYANGSEESGAATNTGGNGSIDYTSAGELSIGARFAGHPLSGINGNVDEVEIFNRALDAAEIFSIYKAGTAGKCALCVAAPTGQVAFYTADGTSEDSVGASEGAMQNGAFYNVGKAASAAFSFDGVDDAVTITRFKRARSAFFGNDPGADLFK